MIWFHGVREDRKGDVDKGEIESRGKVRSSRRSQRKAKRRNEESNVEKDREGGV